MTTKFADLISYFQTIAETHLSILHTSTEKHFYRLEIDEVLSGLSDINYPALILEAYSLSYSDNKSDNPLKTRSGAFILLDHVVDPNDFDTIHSNLDALEVIGDDIISKIRKDKRDSTIKIVKDFKLDSVEVSTVSNIVGNDWGLRFEYELTSPVPLDYDATKWLSSSE